MDKFPTKDKKNHVPFGMLLTQIMCNCGVNVLEMEQSGRANQLKGVTFVKMRITDNFLEYAQKRWVLKSNMLILSLALYLGRHQGNKLKLDLKPNFPMKPNLANLDPNLPPKEKTHLRQHLTLSPQTQSRNHLHLTPNLQILEQPKRGRLQILSPNLNINLHQKEQPLRSNIFNPNLILHLSLDTYNKNLTLGFL